MRPAPVAAFLVFVAVALSCAPAAGPPLRQLTALTHGSAHPASAETVAQQPAGQVPAEYRDLYDALAAKLDAFERALPADCRPDPGGKMIYAAELLAANCSVGERLLNEQYYQGILFWLDAFKSMGISGVKIAIDYPFFTPDYPNNEAYVRAYKRLVQDCRSRGLTVFIANGNLFLNSPFVDASVRYSLGTLTLDKYRQGKRQSCSLEAAELHPDYLTVANEPSGAEALNTGLNQSPAEFAETTRFILSGFEHSGTYVGSGTGTWSDMAYIRELARIQDLDYIDMHIYPVDYLQGAVDAAQIAKAAGKRLALAEIGLYKVRANEMADLGKMATQATIYGRDAFSFWEPLDSRFLEIVSRMARCNGYEFISPFWSTYLYSYVEYNLQTQGLGYGQLSQINNAAAYANARAGKLSGWGETYKRLISTGH